LLQGAGRDLAPGAMNFFKQAGDFLERRQVVVQVGAQQPQTR
jgi:hypothetical protein